MKKLIANVLFAVFCIGINCNAQNTHTLMVNGKALEGKSVVSISFDGDNAKLLLSDNSSLSERMDNVKILFATDPTGIESTRINVFNYNGIVDDYLTIGGIANSSAILIYDASGRLRLQAKPDGNNASIYVGNLGKGVYTAKAGKHVIKFVKK